MTSGGLPQASTSLRRQERRKLRNKAVNLLKIKDGLEKILMSLKNTSPLRGTRSLFGLAAPSRGGVLGGLACIGTIIHGRRTMP